MAEDQWKVVDDYIARLGKAGDAYFGALAKKYEAEEAAEMQAKAEGEEVSQNKYRKYLELQQGERDDAEEVSQDDGASAEEAT